jgi:hypothetical protein
MKPETARMKIWRDAHKKPCPMCGVLIQYDSKFCFSCTRINAGKILFSTSTIGEYREQLAVKGKHPSWVHGAVRGLARSRYRDLLKTPCSNCGYERHVELCHITPLSKWPDGATMGQVNAPENVAILCRNCHWELDHGLIPVDSVRVSNLSSPLAQSEERSGPNG